MAPCVGLLSIPLIGDLGALDFLFDLACRAPDERLRGDWRRLRAAGRVKEIRTLAGRNGLVSALAAFAERLPPEDIDSDARQVVAGGIQAQHGVSTVIELLSRLHATPELANRTSIAIKGVALILDGLYERERDVCDADVLVRHSDLDCWRLAARRLGVEFRAIEGEAHELAYIAAGNALVELHAALPATVAFERGPGFDAVSAHARPPRAASTPPGLLVITGEAAAEISVHHFVFHHGGQPIHALRTIQDLRVLGFANPSSDLLPWGAPSPRHAVVRLSALAHSFASGASPIPAARAEFITRLAKVQALPDSPELAFTDDVRRWIFLHSPDGPSPFRRVVGRLVPPPPAGSRRRPILSTIWGSLRRLVALSTRYSKGQFEARGARGALAVRNSWRSYLASPSRQNVPRS